MQVTDAQIRKTVAALLRERQPAATICPSEAARRLSPSAWRSLMPRVRAVAVAMAKEGLLDIRKGGRKVALDEPLRGPIRLGQPVSTPASHPTTADGRYFVVRGRLWRKSNPNLPEQVRKTLVRELMEARRALRGRTSATERREARERLERAKRALGERGPVWWTDGAPDYNRRLAKNTPYKEWFERNRYAVD